MPLLSDYCVARPCVDLVRLSTRNTTWVVVDIRASLMTILWGALNQSATKPFVISSLLGYGAVGVWHTRKSERFDEVVYKCKFCGNLSVWLMGLLNFVILWNPFKARHPSPSQNLRTHWPFKFGKSFITQENFYKNTKFHVICKYSKLKMQFKKNRLQAILCRIYARFWMYVSFSESQVMFWGHWEASAESTLQLRRNVTLCQCYIAPSTI